MINQKIKKFKVKCDKCGWIQNRFIYKGTPKGKTVKCFKCERTFAMHTNANKTNIINRIR